MSKENEQIFKHCDSFVVLSSDEEKKQEWLKFGQNLGLECIGCLNSSLEGQEEIYSRTPFFEGKIVGLERGKILENSTVIKTIASDIVQKSKYGKRTEEKKSTFEGTIIDDTELGFELGYGNEILTEDGTPIKKVRWYENALPKIYKMVNEKINPNQPVKISGVRANFLLCGLCKALKQKGVKDISIYDVRKNIYISIKDLPKKKGVKQTEGLLFTIIENEENIFMDIDVTKEQYSLEDYEQCVLPQIKGGKNLYLSGRIPLWLLSSICNSYDVNKIFTFQPGKGFTCVSSIDEKELGNIVDGIDGIDINQYFKDKQDKSNEKLPTVIKNQGILSKIKGFFVKLKESRENSKYLDDTIKSKIVVQFNQSHNEKNSFQYDLQRGISKPSKVVEKTLSTEAKGQEMSKKDIGGLE